MSGMRATRAKYSETLSEQASFPTPASPVQQNVIQYAPEARKVCWHAQKDALCAYDGSRASVHGVQQSIDQYRRDAVRQ